MSFASSLLVAAGLFLGAGLFNVQGAALPPVPYDARVEIQGYFTIATERGEPVYVTVPARPKNFQYPLDLSKLKGWTNEQLMKLSGRDGRVTGSLEPRRIWVRRGVEEERLVVVVTNLESIDPDFPNPQEP